MTVVYYFIGKQCKIIKANLSFWPMAKRVNIRHKFPIVALVETRMDVPGDCCILLYRQVVHGIKAQSWQLAYSRNGLMPDTYELPLVELVEASMEILNYFCILLYRQAVRWYQSSILAYGLWKK